MSEYEWDGWGGRIQTVAEALMRDGMSNPLPAALVAIKAYDRWLRENGLASAPPKPRVAA